MSSSATAASYSRAIFELAKESNCLRKSLAELECLNEALTDDVFKLTATPAFHDIEKTAALKAIAEKVGVNRDMMAFFVLVAMNRRLNIFDDIIIDFRNRVLTDEGKTLLRIKSAAPLAQSQIDSIIHKFENAIKGDVEVMTETDKSLIGGIWAQAGSYVYDGSVKGHLQKLKSHLGV